MPNTKSDKLKSDGLLKGDLEEHDHDAIESLSDSEHEELTRILKKIKKAYPPDKKMNANFI